uniref:Uncharacterized protein n=1 Tax=Haematobia irritans TaxID=7368 RepID=A0A1L8E628_HAEIR
MKAERMRQLVMQVPAQVLVPLQAQAQVIPVTMNMIVHAADHHIMVISIMVVVITIIMAVVHTLMVIIGDVLVADLVMVPMDKLQDHIMDTYHLRRVVHLHVQ